MNDYSTSFTVDRTPDEVFDVITDVRGWWTGDITGASAGIGDEFTYRHEDIHRSTQRIIEMVPGERVAWLVIDAHLSMSADPAEWTGTQIAFDLCPVPGGTEVRFTHVGLTPAAECYEACSGAWAYFVNDSLRRRIA